MGWGNAFDRLLDMLPIQGRKERIKNKLEDLQQERKKLLNEPSTPKTSKRITAIDLDIVKYQQLLRNLS